MAIRYLSGVNIDSNTLVVDDVNNRVGVGTASPSVPLHVIGNTLITGRLDFTNANVHVQRNVNELQLGAYSGWRFYDMQGTSTRMFLTQTGNLGIGTTAPQVKLEVRGAQNNTVAPANAVAKFVGNDAGVFVGNLAGTPNYGAWLQAMRESDALVFPLHLQPLGGNVGIGTTSPGYKLDVAGEGKVTGKFRVGGAVMLAEPGTGVLLFGSEGGSQTAIYSASLERIRINSSGNVGIGTTSPVKKLDVAGEIQGTNFFAETYRSSRADGDIYIQAVGSGDFVSIGTQAANNILRVQGNGNVGIGTTSPTVTLEVSGRGLITSSGSSDTFAVTHSSGSGIGINITKGGNGEGLYVNKTSGSGNAVTIVGTLNATTLVKSGGTSSQYLMADGSVSTLTNPVTGTGTTNYVPKWTSGSAIGNSAIYDNAGNIGIGVTNADYPLTVGSINVGAVGAQLGLILNSVINTAIPSSSVKAIIGATNSGFGYAAGSLLIQPRTGVNAVTVFATEGTEKMRITHDGNVGIGATTFGTAKLVVNGNLGLSGTSGAVYGPYFPETGDHTGSLTMQAGFGSAAAGGAITLFGHLNTTKPGWVTIGISQSAGTGATEGRFTVNNSATAGGTDVFTVLRTGNVGIGTTNPNEKLTILGSAATTFQGAGIYNSYTYGNADKAESRFNLGKLEGSTYQPMGAIGASPTDNTSSIDGYLSFYTRTSASVTEKMRITAGGNVGIGTTSPSVKLDVNGAQIIRSAAGFGTDSDQAALFLSNTSNYGLSGNFSGYSRNLIKSDGASLLTIGRRDTSLIGELSIESGSSGIIKLLAGGSERLRITSGGNVGIGTTNPITKLQIDSVPDNQAAIFANQVYARIALGPQNSSGDVSFGSSGNGAPTVGSQDYGFYAAHNAYRSSTGAWKHTRTSTIPAVRLLGSGGVSSGNQGFSFDYSANVGTADITWTNLMQILPTGNVGIGTTSPTQKLHVYGKIKLEEASGGTVLSGNYGYFKVSPTNNYGVLVENSSDVTKYFSFGVPGDYGQIRYKENTGSAITVTASGVGIGTTSPAYKLDVNGTIGFPYSGSNANYIEQGNALGYGRIRPFNNSGLFGFDTNYTAGGGYDFAYNGSSVIRVTSTGNVGIGTTSPGHKLDVEGNIRAKSGTYYIGTTATNYLSSDGVNVYLRTNAVHYFEGNGFQKGAWNSSGNLGIGTISPNEKLSLAGSTGTTFGLSLEPSGWNSAKHRFTVPVSGDTSMWSFNYNGSVVDSSLYATSSIQIGQGAILFSTGGTNTAPSEKMRITSAGNVGIGTTSPVAQLQIGNGTSNASNRSSVAILSADGGNAVLNALSLVNSRTAANGNGTAINFHNAYNYSPTGRIVSIQDDGTNASLRFSVYNSTDNQLVERVTLLSSGNVGIGTTSPAQKLDVAGNININSISFGYRINNINALSSSAAYTNLHHPEGGIAIYLGDSADRTNYYDNSAHRFRNAGGSSDYVVINSSGNVGIGTTSPSDRLHIYNNGDVGIRLQNQADTSGNTWRLWQDNWNGVSNFTFNVDYGSTNVLTATTAGNVGIGTTAPSSRLHVVGDILASASSGNRSVVLTTNNANAALNVIAGLGAELATDGTNQNIAFRTGASTRMYIASSGNVGIGTTAPSQKLHVTGNFRVTGAYYDSNNEAGTSGQVLTSTGSGTDWKSLSEITGVDGTGTANYVAKWSDTDTITNSQIRDDGTTVGIGVAPGPAKLTVNGSAQLGSRAIYVKSYASLDTTGVAVAGLITSTNGDSSLFEFTCNGGAGQYQRIVYACHNTTGTWNARKVIDEGTNELDVVASASAATITFTFKARTTGQGFTPRVTVEVTGPRDVSYL